MRQPVELDLGYINSIRINASSIKRRAATLLTRRTFKNSVERKAQNDAYIRAIQCMDLTDLTGDCTEGRVIRLCAKALQPVESKTLIALGYPGTDLTTAAVCVYDRFVADAKRYLHDRIPVAAVSTGFPAGQISHEVKLAEIEHSIKSGAKEIDVVITREFAQWGQWKPLYDEIVSFRDACGGVHMKTILAVGDIADYEKVAKASAVAIMAGSDFIKTSTGFEKVNATPEYGIIMARQIRRWLEYHPDDVVGFKPAGGIKTAKDAQLWLTLMLEELDERWTRPELFRLGASSLLTDLERQLYYHAFGRYPATRNIPIG